MPRAKQSHLSDGNFCKPVKTDLKWDQWQMAGISVYVRRASVVILIGESAWQRYNARPPETQTDGRTLSLQIKRIKIGRCILPAVHWCEITGTIGIFKGCKLLFTNTFPNCKGFVFGKLEDVKYKLFHFDSVRAIRCHSKSSGRVHVWNFFLCYMMNQIPFVFTNNAIQEFSGEVVDANIGSWVGQRAIGVALFSRFLSDLRIFHNL